jgi:hypothetical protein
MSGSCTLQNRGRAESRYDMTGAKRRARRREHGTSYDEVARALTDGRLERIIDEHIRHMKETDRGFRAL